MLRSLFLICAIVLCSLSQSQNTIGTTYVTDMVYDGYTLFSIHNKTYLVNNCGNVLNQWTSNYLPGNAVYLLANGNILRAGKFDDGTSTITFGGQGGIIELFDWEGNILWSYEYISSTYRQHHDVYPMPNGNVLILAATIMSGQDAIQAGRDPLKLSDNELYNERIIEVEPVGLNQGNIVWEWNIKDHLIQDIDATKDNFGDVANNPRKLDINFLNGNDSGDNWLHVNSIQYDELRDQIVLSSRLMSELYIIDHSTTTIEASESSGGTYGNGGDFLYRWGNPQSYRQGTEVNRQLFGQHMPYFIPENLPNSGNILLFNNGAGRTPLFSEALMITPPSTSLGEYIIENNKFGPDVPDYTYPNTTPTEDSDFFSAILSNAQQLPNGNILVCEGREGHFFELDQNNNVVWDYIIPISSIDGTAYTQNDDISALSNRTFRARKYASSYAAFDNRDLTPGEPLEINPNIEFCEQTLNVDEFFNSKIAIYPNPTKNYINIKYNQGLINKVEIYNLIGEKVLERKDSNVINIEQLEIGLYLLKITVNDKIFTKKLLKSK